MKLIQSFTFAAFVITKDRPDTLFITLELLLSQTLPPKYILVVDNSEYFETRDRILLLDDMRIGYHNVGYNSGPAGGAYWGLKLLFEKDYDWVLWVDDDDPPKFNNLIENLFKIILENDKPSLGMVGAVGGIFDRQSAKIIRLQDEQLKGYIEVDTISGNMFPLVSKRVFDAGILPTSDFFFGFEDLGFCLSVRRAGLQILISGDLHYRHRVLAGRLKLKQILYHKRYTDSIWRDYYSIRSLIYILKYQEKNRIGVLVAILRNLMKIFLLFRYGFSYGLHTSAFILRGMIDGLLGRMGRTVSPKKKVVR